MKQGSGEISPSSFGYKIGNRIKTTHEGGSSGWFEKNLGNYRAQRGDKGIITGFKSFYTEILYDNGQFGYRNESSPEELFEIIEEPKPEPNYEIY